MSYTGSSPYTCKIQSLQGDTSVVVLFVLCFGVILMCCLNLMYMYVFIVLVTVNILLNARAFIINNAFSIEGDGRLLKTTLFGNVQMSKK